MHTVKTETAVAMTRGNTANAEPIIMRKRIGSIVYEVEVHFNPGTKESMNEKLLRLIRNEMGAAS